MMDQMNGSNHVLRYHDHKLEPKSDMQGYDLFIRIGSMTYRVTVHFSRTSQETLCDKICP